MLIPATYRQTMFRLFDPVIQEIVKLVVEQVRDVQIKRLESKNKNGSDVKVRFSAHTAPNSPT